MRSEMPPLCGRDHLAFRSYYFPVRNVIDGDLCEMYNSLDTAKQRSIADELDRTASEVRGLSGGSGGWWGPNGYGNMFILVIYLLVERSWESLCVHRR